MATAAVAANAAVSGNVTARPMIAEPMPAAMPAATDAPVAKAVTPPAKAPNAAEVTAILAASPAKSAPVVAFFDASETSESMDWICVNRVIIGTAADAADASDVRTPANTA